MLTFTRWAAKIWAILSKCGDFKRCGTTSGGRSLVTEYPSNVAPRFENIIKSEGPVTVHRPMIILASFIIIGLALFYFQPGMKQSAPPTEIATLDDASTFAPTPNIEIPTADQGQVFAETQLTSPSFSTDVSMESVMSSDVMVQVQEAQSMPMPSGLQAPSLSSATIIPAMPQVESPAATQTASVGFETPSAPTLQFSMAEPEVTRAAIPNIAQVIDSEPTIDTSVQLQPSQPVLTSAESTSGFF